MTAQAWERLIMDGVETGMAFCPPLPEGHPRLAETDPEQAPVDEYGLQVTFSTACWRGYIGTWEIKDGRLYLVGLVGRFGLVGEEPLFADWFSGVLRIPRGKQLQYVHMGYGSVYEYEKHIKIEQGVVAGTRVINNRGKKLDRAKLALDSLPGSENRFEGEEW